MKALIQNGLVVDVSPTEFDVHSDLTWVDCPDYIVAQAFEYDGTNFTEVEPIKSISGYKADLQSIVDTWTNLTAEQTAYSQALSAIDPDDYDTFYQVNWPTLP